MYKQLIENWASKESFEVWLSDHKTVMNNLSRFLDRMNGSQISNERLQIFDQIETERIRQDNKWGEQNLEITEPTSISLYKDLANDAKKNCNDSLKDGTITWQHILYEEYCEVFAEDDPNKQAEELIQVAAVCVSMIECLKRNRKID